MKEMSFKISTTELIDDTVCDPKDAILLAKLTSLIETNGLYKTSKKKLTALPGIENITDTKDLRSKIGDLLSTSLGDNGEIITHSLIGLADANWLHGVLQLIKRK